MKRILLLIVCIFIFAPLALARAQTVIKAEVEKARITTDETLTYKIIITSSEKKLPLPAIPEFKGFNVISQAQSSTMSFMQSEIKTVLVYAFILSPTETGKLKIAAPSIKIGNQTYTAESFEVEVTQGKTIPQPKSEEEESAPKYTL